MTQRHDIHTLLSILRALRDPVTGCPWALRQDFSSIAPHTIEEAYEVADAIQRADMPGLRDELGDLMLQVAFHAHLADEKGAFSFEDVVYSICEKLIKRNPHVFGDGRVGNAEAQSGAWETMKQAERKQRGATSLMDGIPVGMAELQRSIKLQKRAAHVGFDWAAPAPVLEKLQEETEELIEAMASGDRSDIEDELGDLLFVMTNLARQLKVDPAAALRGANAKFEQRFRAMERAAGSQERLKAMDLEEMESLWQQVKESLRREGPHE